MAKPSTFPLLTPSEAAELLKITESTLATLRVSGNGPRYRKLGGSVRYTKADLLAWVKNGARQRTSEASS